MNLSYIRFKLLSISLILLLIINSQLIAQTDIGTINGRVLNENGWPVSFAMIVCKNLSDSLKVYKTATDNNGSFIFEKIAEGNYKLNIVHISFEQYRSDTLKISLEHKTTNLGKLVLKEKNKEIQEVTVFAEKRLYKNDVRKHRFEVSSNILKKVSTSSELLNQIPGVSVDALGSVEVQGKSKILFLVNGVKYEGSDPLKIISPSQIKEVVIITNIPSRYISEGYNAIIDIKLKNTDQGLDGYVYISPPTKPFYNNGLSLNYNINKTRIYTSYDFTIKNYSYDLEDNYFINNTKTITNKIDNATVNSNDHKVTLGSDIFLNEKNYLNISSRLKINEFTSLEPKSIISFIKNTNNENQINKNLSNSLDNNLSLFYKHLFNGESNKIESEVIYYTLSSYDNYAYYDSIKSEANLSRRENLNYSDNSVKGNVNYSYNSNDEKMEFNVGYNFYNDRMSGNYYNWVDNKNISYNNLRNNIYTDYSYTLSKVSFLFGMGAESNSRKIGQITKKYTNFYPTGDISWEINKRNSIDIAYKKIIKRPDYWQLEPDAHYPDSSTVNKGNPYLNDYASNRYELTYTFIKRNNYISFGCYYEKTPNIIEPFSYIENNIRINTYENINSEILKGLNMASAINIFSWWKLKLSADLFNQQLVNISNTKSLTCISFNHYSIFTFSKGFSFTYQIKYKTKSLVPGGYQLKAPFMSLYLNKKIFKNAANISIIAIQPFIKYKNKTIIENSNYNIDSYQNIRYKGVLLSFTYNFHSGKTISRKIKKNTDWIENSKSKSDQ